MKQIQKNETSVVWELGIDEAYMIHSALNEVCNGVHIEDPEFQTRLGYYRGQLKELLSQIGASLDDR